MAGEPRSIQELLRELGIQPRNDGEDASDKGDEAAGGETTRGDEKREEQSPSPWAA